MRKTTDLVVVARPMLAGGDAARAVTALREVLRALEHYCLLVAIPPGEGITLG